MVSEFAACGLAVALLGGLALAQSSGSASGTVTVNGKANPMKYAYAVPGEMGYDAASKQTLVVLSDVPLTPFELEDPFAEKDLGKAGKLHGVTVQLDEQNNAVSAFLYDAAFGEATVTLTGGMDYAPKVFDDKMVSGKVSMGASELTGVSFQFDVSFEAPRYHRPPPTAEGAAAAASGPGSVVTAFLAAVAKKDKAGLEKVTADPLLSYLQGPHSAEVMAEITQDMPAGLKVLRVTEIGDEAVVELGHQSKTERELKAARIAGEWKVKP